ncbi:unnamed protein product, partial [marine sediment metagenome]
TCGPELVGRAARELKAKGETPSREDVEELAAELLAEAEKANRILDVWDAEATGVDLDSIGLNGSATKVKKIESVVLAGADLVKFEPTEEDCAALIKELVGDHIIG